MESTVRIERYADQGRCVGHVEGRVVFVRFALPGELVRVRLDEPTNRADRFWTGEVVEVLEASDDRCQPSWTLAGPSSCGGGVGGADMVHVSLEGQLRWKAAIIAEQMRRLGHIDVEDIEVARMPTDVAMDGLHWRTRIEMIADGQGRPSMRRRASHDRVPLDTMPLASHALLAVADRHGIWNGGFEPGAKIRIAVPQPRSVQASTQDVPTLVEAVDDDFAVMVDGELRFGRAQLDEKVRVGGVDFAYTVAAGGFWQMHHQAPLALANHVLDQVRRLLDGASSAILWDLYAGSGLFTVPLSQLAAERVGMLAIEGDRTAARHAQANLRAHGSWQVEVRVGDVAATMGRIPGALRRPDVVVLDPPRAGAKAKVCRAIAASGAKAVVYVACDPASLARDAAILADEGYVVEGIQAFDIYPMTHHVETVAVFRAQGR